MFRIIMGVLAAFVGFSFGHSIPKWLESKTTSCTGAQSLSFCEPAQRAPHKHSFRRKSLRKFKFGFQKSGKGNGERNGSLQKWCNDNAADAGVNMLLPPHEDNGCVQNVPLYAHIRFGCHRLQKKKSKVGCSNQVHDSTEPAKLPSDCQSSEPDACTILKDGCHIPQGASTDGKISRHGLSQIASSQLNSLCITQQDMQANVEAAHHDPELAASKGSSLHSSCGSSPSTKEKRQVKQWKMKLMSLRSKAMASEKVWYEKFDKENCGGKLLAASSTGLTMAMKKTAMEKEHESPHQNTKKRDFFWSRSSSKVGLLVEGPKSALER